MTDETRTPSTGRGTEPEDARRGVVPATPADLAEAVADREMADAERAVASRTATEVQARRVAALLEGRTQEERRRLWRDSA